MMTNEEPKKYYLKLKHLGGALREVEVMGVDPYIPRIVFHWADTNEPYFFDLRKMRIVIGRKQLQWTAENPKEAIELWVHLKSRMRYLQRNLVTDHAIRCGDSSRKNTRA